MYSLFRRFRRPEASVQSGGLVSESGKLRLDPLKPSEVVWVDHWFADSQSCSLAFGVETNRCILGKMAQDYVEDLHSDRSGVFLIRLNDKQELSQPIGFLRFKLFHQDRRKLARVGIMLGQIERRGQGLGTEAMKTLLAYLFNSLKVRTVELDTAVFNLAAQKCFSKCGFKTIRETELIGLYDDRRDRRLIMRLDRTDWTKDLARKYFPI